MSTKFVFALLFLLFSAKIYKIKADPIKTMEKQTNDIKTNYYVAKVIPPGAYRVIIWDHFITRNDLPTIGMPIDSEENDKQLMCDFDDFFSIKPSAEKATKKPFFYIDKNLQGNFNEMSRCFLHFYTVKTDEKGQFLMNKCAKIRFDATMFEDHSYKFYLLPLHNSNPIAETDHIDELYAVQNIFLLKNWMPVDSLCEFSGDHCLIRYFESTDQWKNSATSALNHWLYDKFSWTLADKEHFFLTANFDYLIELATKNRQNDTKISLKDANLIDLFWHNLAQSANEGQLWKRLRLVDQQQIVPIINELCKIKWHKLMKYESIEESTKHFLMIDHFCTLWPNVQQKAEHFADNARVIEAFRRWVFLPRAQLGTESAQIVHASVELFAARTGANLMDTWWKWRTNEMNIFSCIGSVFANAKELFALTLDQINGIGGTKELLDKICENINNNNMSFKNLPVGNLKETIGYWERKNCENGKFRFCPPTKCVICMRRERLFAFDPCGHLCACEQCAELIEKSADKKCPICRAQIVKKLRIYRP